LSHTPVGSGGLQGGDHIFDADLLRVVGDGVDFTEPFKSPGYFFDSRQPFQGRLADVVSGDIKCNFGKRPLRITGSCNVAGICQ
jgi:hypothetical protein